MRLPTAQADGLLEFPPASAIRTDVLLSDIRVRDFHAGAIPFEFLTRASCNISKKQSLRNHAGEFEIGTRLVFAALTGIEPFAFVSR